MTYKIQWRTRPIGMPQQITPEVVYHEIERVRREHGGKLFPCDLLEASTKRASPIHDYFEWDDAKAAHQFRMDQARCLIRSVILVRKEGTQAAYVHVNVEKEQRSEQYYQHSDLVQADEYSSGLEVIIATVRQALTRLEEFARIGRNAKRSPADMAQMGAAAEALMAAHAILLLSIDANNAKADLARFVAIAEMLKNARTIVLEVQ